ncbi:hypothetical protein [Edaphobacter modestus]|uniref:Uncharacterized protein n=1 Tax=Edaphobacter modestus TaxID=388466 RepID=A0A4Q7YUM1_9BACT|nr:hypothetical protein [Edaphobacter modestus]RZU41320.1 hypothetical protein BDD14_2833 [Edaphobacter modestus]
MKKLSLAGFASLLYFAMTASVRADQSSPVMRWSDRRPIGELMLAPVTGQGAINAGFGNTNPRGWLNDRTIDITNSAGIVDFQRKILKYADQSIGVLQSIKAQGAITWDLEGEQYPQDTTYIGDPSLATTIAPEWESIVSGTNTPYDGMKLIDAYFKKFTDAGLRTGVTLRPQTMEFGNFSDCKLPGDLNHTCQPFSIDEKAQVNVLNQKIAYAKQRWGVTLFYVDSNVKADQVWSCYPPECNNNPASCPATCSTGSSLILGGGKSRLGSGPLEASVFASVAAANPDVLLIPEHNYNVHDVGHADYFAVTTPLYQLFQDYGGVPARTSDEERASVPGAFSAIIINNAGLTIGDQRFHELVQGVRNGDILIARAWFQEPDLDIVRAIYNEAGVARVVTQPALVQTGK